MTRRGQMSAAAAIATIAGLLLPITSVGAAVFTPSADLPDGTAAAPAAATPSDTTSVVEWLDAYDVDAFEVCVTDPVALDVIVEGVDENGTPRAMDTVTWLLDADGMLVASNDDRSATDLGSELVAGAAAATSPGVHVLAFAPFRSMPLDAAGADMEVPGSGPLTSWRLGNSTEAGLVKVDLVAGATGSEACGTEPGSGTEVGPEVMTGNGRCQALGGQAVDHGKAKGLDRAAEAPTERQLLTRR